MSGKSLFVRDLNPPDDQLSTFHQPMDVIAKSDAHNSIQPINLALKRPAKFHCKLKNEKFLYALSILKFSI
jgi:hypothetical protein